MSRKSLLALGLFVGLILMTAGGREAGPTSHQRSAIATASLDAAAARVAVGPLDSPQSFTVEGRVDLTLDDERIHGNFALAFFVEADGRVTITRVRIRLRAVHVSYVFDEDRFVCNSAFNVEPIHGTMDMTGNLMIPVRALALSATSYSQRGPRGGCPGRGAVRAGLIKNEGPLRGRHDPAANEFKLDGAFTGRISGDDYDITIKLTGIYTNRPPVANLGVDGPGVRLAQGGCPLLNTENPPTTEANHLLGLQVNLISTSVDPDSRRGTPDRSDIFLEQWYHNRGSDPYEFLGRGQVVGPVLFEFGPLHRLVLRVTDRAGASSTDGCVFTVADRTPPLVIAPERVTIPCSEPGGASLRTSGLLRAFFKRAKARDNSDPALAPLPPQITKKGSTPVDITETTLFPTDPRRLPDSSSFTPVTFRFRDRHGNLGTASSGVRVAGRASPTTTVNLDAVADANTVSSQPNVSFGTKPTKG